MTRGERLKQLRQRCQSTQRAMATAIGTTVVQWQRWESNRCQPNAAYWNLICREWPEVSE